MSSILEVAERLGSAVRWDRLPLKISEGLSFHQHSDQSIQPGLREWLPRQGPHQRLTLS